MYQCFLFNDFKSEHAKWHNSNTPKIICDQQVLGSAACSQWTLEMWFLHFLQCLWTFTFSERCEALHLFFKTVSITVVSAFAFFSSKCLKAQCSKKERLWLHWDWEAGRIGYSGTERLSGLVILGQRGNSGPFPWARSFGSAQLKPALVAPKWFFIHYHFWFL